MKVKLYRKWLTVIKKKFDGHFQTRCHDDLCLLASRIWRYGSSPNIHYPEKSWVRIDRNSSAEYSGLEKVWKIFKYKYRKYSRKYWTANAKIMRDLTGEDCAV